VIVPSTVVRCPSVIPSQALAGGARPDADAGGCGGAAGARYGMEMTTQRFRHLPVVEGRRVIGIVSIGDVVKQRIAVAELEASSMRQYIATG
jgi:CBS domain-containing protein